MPADQVEESKGGLKRNINKSNKHFYLKYTDIHNPNEDEQKDLGVAEVYMIMSVAAGMFVYFYRVKHLAWVCLFLMYSSCINQ